MRIIAIALAAVMTLGYLGAKFYLHYKTERGMEEVVQKLAPFADIRYGGISSTFTGELTLDDLSIRVDGFEDAISIESLGIDLPSMMTFFELRKMLRNEPGKPGELPEYFGVFAEDLRIASQADYYKKLYQEVKNVLNVSDIDEPGPKCVGKYGIFAPSALNAMGYDSQVVSYAARLRQGESEFYIDLDIAVEDMFDMKISLSLGGDMMTELSKGQRYRPQLSQLRIEHADRSLIKRIRDYCTELGLTPEQILAAHMDALDYFGKKNRIAFDQQIVKPYQAFLGGKSNLVITAKPLRLVDFGEISFYNPRDVPALLNLEVVAR